VAWAGVGIRLSALIAWMVVFGRSYALRDAAMAHRDIESRANTGSLLLIP